MFDKLNFAALSAQINTKFRIIDTADAVELELAEAVGIKITETQEIFSLIFLGPGDSLLPQRTYEVAHEKLGSGVVFLVPVGQSEAGIRYEAAFNRTIGSPN